MIKFSAETAKRRLGYVKDAVSKKVKKTIKNPGGYKAIADIIHMPGYVERDMMEKKYYDAVKKQLGPNRRKKMRASDLIKMPLHPEGQRRLKRSEDAVGITVDV